MSKRPSRKLHKRLEGLFAGAPEANPSGSNGGGRAAGPASGVPGGWLWEADLQGHYTWCSPEVERFLGWRSGDLIGKDVASVGFSEESAAMLRPMIHSGRAVDGLRLEARASDGSEIQLLFSAQLRPGLNGKPAGFRGVAQVLSVVSRPPSEEVAPPVAPEPEELQPSEPPAPQPDKPKVPEQATGPLPRRQTSPLHRPQTGPLATQLVISAPVLPEEVKPMESPPLLPAWGATTAYLDTADGIQPMAGETSQRVTEPHIDGSRLLVPIRVKDEVLGVLAFDENEQGRAWNEDDVTMALAITEQLAVALQDARSVQLTEQALEEMREADRLKTQFLANMSHELRTPLNSIIGFSRVILKGIDGPVNETQEQDLSAIHNAGLHLLGLINDILDLSKIEAGKMELTFGDANLADIIRGVMSTAAGLVKDKPIELISHVPDNLPLLQADSIRLRQILLNLVSNAAKFTDRGQIEVSVTLAEDADPAEVLVAVADTGPGIEPEAQAKLFEPFSQVDASPTRKTGGTGLGLSICRHLVELHGGTIWLESRPGHGSVFFFTLPVEPPTPAAEVEAMAAAPLVLAIDDDPAVLSRYRALFEGLGFRFSSLPQTDGVAEFARRSPPDLILIDPMLPGYGGWNAITALRGIASTRHAPILMGSINAEKDMGFRIHASDHRLAASEGDELLAAVHRLVPSNGRPLRLLVIEDDEDQAAAIRQTVETDRELNLRLASSSTEAYHATRTETPDVVILNLMMARAEGFRALEILRKDPRLRGTPVLVLLSPEPHPEERRQMGLYTEYLHRQGTASPEEYLADLQNLAQTLLSPR